MVKIPLYDEPEGVTFLVLDAILLTLLLLARRVRCAHPAPERTRSTATCP